MDAGAHLARIIGILEHQHGLPWNSVTAPSKSYSKTLTDGPFAGIKCPSISARANALYIFRELVHAFLITHPHLDHISGMGINTPALEYGREAKAIVALPSTIEAIKNHIFNDVIWPNLSDEGDGVGFVTYRRLMEGGNPRFGSGDGRGYVNVCEGLATKCWSVSHGRCRRHRGHSISHQRDGSLGFAPDGYPFSTRRISQVSDGHGGGAMGASHHASMAQAGYPRTPGGHSESNDASAHFQAVDSSAFFIRNDANGHEIIVFGDLEPDSVSLRPRNHVVWEDAGPKVASGTLKAIFIECSYDDSVRDEDLYGHLCPRHLIAELSVLAGKVMTHRRSQQGMNLQEPPSPGALRKKRKRNIDEPSVALKPAASAPTRPFYLPPGNPGPTEMSPTAQSPTGRLSSPRRGRTVHVVDGSPDDLSKDVSDDPVCPLTPGGSLARPPGPGRHPNPHSPVSIPSRLPAPLKGLTVFIIHVKDTLADAPPQGDVILEQLQDQGNEAGLGCEFEVTSDGESIWL